MRKIAHALPLIGAAIKRGEATTRFLEYELTPAGKAVRMAQAKKKAQCATTHHIVGIAAVQYAFHFLDGPADVLAAATACHRWGVLATDDSVSRARFVSSLGGLTSQAHANPL